LPIQRTRWGGDSGRINIPSRELLVGDQIHHSGFGQKIGQLAIGAPAYAPRRLNPGPRFRPIERRPVRRHAPPGHVARSTIASAAITSGRSSLVKTSISVDVKAYVEIASVKRLGHKRHRQ